MTPAVSDPEPLRPRPLATRTLFLGECTDLPEINADLLAFAVILTLSQWTFPLDLPVSNRLPRFDPLKELLLSIVYDLREHQGGALRLRVLSIGEWHHLLLGVCPLREILIGEFIDCTLKQRLWFVAGDLFIWDVVFCLVLFCADFRQDHSIEILELVFVSWAQTTVSSIIVSWGGCPSGLNRLISCGVGVGIESLDAWIVNHIW